MGTEDGERSETRETVAEILDQASRVRRLHFAEGVAAPASAEAAVAEVIARVRAGRPIAAEELDFLKRKLAAARSHAEAVPATVRALSVADRLLLEHLLLTQYELPRRAGTAS